MKGRPGRHSVQSGSMTEMAKNKNKKGLFGAQSSDERASANKQEEDAIMKNAIDLTSGADDDSDSELDLNALLKKYMPEYQDEEAEEKKKPEADDLSALFDGSESAEPQVSAEASENDNPVSELLDSLIDQIDSDEEEAQEEKLPEEGGLLSRMKEAVEEADEGETEDPESGIFSRIRQSVEDEQEAESSLISALDSAFSLPGNDDFSEPAKENDAAKRRADDLISEYEIQQEEEETPAADAYDNVFSEDAFDFGDSDGEAYDLDQVQKPVGEEVSDEAVEELFDDGKEKQKKFSLFRRKNKEKKKSKKAAELDEDLLEPEEFISEEQPVTEAVTSPETAAEEEAEKPAEPEIAETPTEIPEETPETKPGLAESVLAIAAEEAEAAEKAAETIEAQAAEEKPAEPEIPESTEPDPLGEAAEALAETAAAFENVPQAEKKPKSQAQKRSATNMSDEELLRWAAESLADSSDFSPETTPQQDETTAAPISALSQLESLLSDDDTPETAEAESEPSGETESEGGWKAPETPYEEEEFDPTDINLMVAFGLDDDKGKKADRAKELGDKLEAKQQNRDTAVKIDRTEFVDKSQIPDIRKEYRNRSVSLFVRLILCFVFGAILFLFENIEAVSKLITGTGMQFGGIFDPSVYPGVYAMTSLQIMLLACLCAYDEIATGIKSIFRGSPRPESMTALLALGGIIYSAVIAHITVSPNEPVMFNFIVALAAFMTLIYSVFNNKREMMNFRIVSSKRPKHIVRRLKEDESEGEARAFADAEDACDVMKIEKTDFIDGFFARLQKPDQTTGTFMMFVMGATVLLSVVFGIFARLRGSAGTEVARVTYESLLMLSPLSVFITFAYPFYRANVTAQEYDSAIIGETSLEEYSNASIISFDDKNVFPSYFVKVQNIRIYNNARIDRVLYYASSVFAYAGGPLQDVFEVATKDLGNSTNVKIYGAEAGFLATKVDGVNITFGSCEELLNRGFSIPDDAVEDDVDLSDELSIMYMFRENKLVAKMYIKYEMDADIDLILKQFSGNGLYACVRTFDPNIDEEMIAKKLSMKKMPLKIVRYANMDEVVTYEAKVDSGLVTCGSQKSLLQVISYCGKVLRTKKTHIALSVLSIIIGASIVTLLLFADLLGSMSSLFIALYQLLWLIPTIITSRAFIR